MKAAVLRAVVAIMLAAVLSGCYQVQVKGPVAGASVLVTELDVAEVQLELTSWNIAFLTGVFGTETWDSFDDFRRLILLGVFLADASQFDPERFYLLTASGGEDFDIDQDLAVDAVGTAVQSPWHSFVEGADLKVAGVQVSALTEVVYQYLSPRVANLPAVDLRLQLDLLARRVVGDVSDDGAVDYRDLLEWSQMFDRDQLLIDQNLLADFEDALLSGADAVLLQELAVDIIESGAPRSGEMVYRFTQPTGNSFTCASCHALVEPALNGLRRPGHPLGSATHRPNYKDGQLGDMLDAANSCLDEWMNANSWSESSPDWLALSDWLEQRAAPGEAAPVDIQIVAAPDSLAGGDATQGRALFNGSCAICHAVDGAGSIQAPAVAGFGLDGAFVANRVRGSGRSNSAVYEGLNGGIMPFWGANRLSDSELIDIVAYLELGEDANRGDIDTGDDGATADPAVCGSDHAKVGQSTTLLGRAHRVGGVATIIDNCTVELSQFTYDGGGIVVQAYTGVDGNFFGAGAHAISTDLVGPRYNNATLTFTLPDGVSLDDFNSLSIWCVEVGVSFGDGTFQ